MSTFGDPALWPDQDLVGLSHEFSAELALTGYVEGVFPMPLYWGDFHGEMGWWSPTRRGVLPPDGLRVTRSLRHSARRYRVTVDAAFPEVLERCADRRRPDGWIDGRVKTAYAELFGAGIVHSVEAWTPGGRLAGGLYGVGIGGLFAGESMFHDDEVGRDASKVALVELVRILLADSRPRLLDVQWATDHLASLGVVEVPRIDYLELLDEALILPPPDWEAARARTA